MVGGISDPEGARRRVHLPAEAFLYLRRAVREEVGSPGDTRALNTAGSALGESLFEDFAGASACEPGNMGQEEFWQRLTEFFGDQGWGRLSHERIHPGLGMLRTEGWAESAPGSGESQPGCAFTEGLLMRFLSRLAGGPVAVLEVACAGRGDGECSFLFGSGGAIQGISGVLAEGLPLSTALARL